MKHKTLTLTVALVLAAFIFLAAQNITQAEKKPVVSLPGLPSISLPIVSLPDILPSRDKSGGPSGLPSSITNVPLKGEFDWLNWWKVNVSYLMPVRKEAHFYREVEINVDDIPAILSLLNYNGIFFPVTRDIAIRCLEKLEDEGIKELTNIVKGKWNAKLKLHPSLTKPKFQGLAAFALGYLRSEGCFDALVGLLKDPRPDTRMLAVLGLGHLGSSKAEEKLIKLLADERDDRVAAAAMFSLASIGSERSRRALLLATEESDRSPIRKGMSYLAIALLAKNPSFLDIEKAIFSSECPLWLAGLSAKAVLASNTAPSEKKVNDVIKASLSHCEGTTQLVAILPLYLLKDSLELGDLSKLFGHPDPKVRSLVRFIAVTSGSPRLANAIVGDKADKDPQAANLQSIAVAYISAPDRAKYARELMGSKDMMTKICGILALGANMTRTDVYRIRANLKTAKMFDADVAFLLALSRSAPKSVTAWNELTSQTRSRARHLQDIAMVLVGATGTNRAARYLLDLKGRQVDSLPYSIALSLLGPLPYELTLRKGLEVQGDITRASAVLAYSFIPLDSARATLFEWLDSGSVPIARAHAAIGLLQYEEETLTKKQAQILSNAASTSGDDWVRAYSTLALGKFAKNSVIAGTLERMLQDANINVRAMAAFSMGIFNYPTGVFLLRDQLQREKSNAAMAQMIALGMYKRKIMEPYISSRIKKSASDDERLAYAAALAKSIDMEHYDKLLDAMGKSNAIDMKTYAWALALHEYPEGFDEQKIIAGLRRISADKNKVTFFHVALARCALGDGLAARDLLDAISSKAFYYKPVLPEPRFLIEYFQVELPRYGKIIPYFFDE